MPKAKSKTHNVQEVDPEICVFCGDSDDVEEIYGKKIRKCNVTVHYFCMLFSSGLCQRGRKDTQGLLGFLPEDIRKEVRRGFRLRCCYCKKKGATIGCIVTTCRKAFHLGCGQKNGTLHQFFDTFASYCESHRPRQTNHVSDRLAFYGTAKTTCPICMNAVQARASNETLRSPCCKGAWFHRLCIQRYSLSAGLYYFKCPLCNNTDTFQAEMLHFGIFIPDQDAAWELENDAYNALLERYSHCDAANCLCPEGKNYDKAESKWEIIICEWCGSKGCHLKCDYLVYCRDDWVCPDCFELDEKMKSENPSTRSSAKKKAIKKFSPTPKMSRREIEKHLKEKGKQQALHSSTSSDTAGGSTPTSKRNSITPRRGQNSYSLRNKSRFEYQNNSIAISDSSDDRTISDDSGNSSSSDYTEIINVVIETSLPDDDEASSFISTKSPPQFHPEGYYQSSTEESDDIEMPSSHSSSKKSRKRRIRHSKWSKGITRKKVKTEHHVSISGEPPVLDPVYETISETSSVTSEIISIASGSIKTEYPSSDEDKKDFSAASTDTEDGLNSHRNAFRRNIFDSLMTPHDEQSPPKSKSKYMKKQKRGALPLSPHQTTLEKFLHGSKASIKEEPVEPNESQMEEIGSKSDSSDISDVEITSMKTRKLKIKWGDKEIYLKRKIKSKPVSLSVSCKGETSCNTRSATRTPSKQCPCSSNCPRKPENCCVERLPSMEYHAEVKTKAEECIGKSQPFDAISISSDVSSIISISSTSSLNSNTHESNGKIPCMSKVLTTNKINIDRDKRFSLPKINEDKDSIGLKENDVILSLL